MTERQTELEPLGAKIKPGVRGWIDNVIVPSLVEEWLAQGREDHLAEPIKRVTQFERRQVSSAKEIA